MTNNGQPPYQVLLYYKYAKIDDPQIMREDHLAFCKKLGLKGRILVSDEGINGTVSGTKEATDQYMRAMHADPRFKDMVFKIDPADGHTFRKMQVKAREEIVSLKLDEDLNPNQETGNHLPPEKFFEAMQDDDVIILDARNKYEHEIGHFKNAVLPEVDAFRELPDWIRKNLADKKDKKVLAYCTGGIRCEKLTGFLKREGFKDVNQLEGGIVSYGKDEQVKGRYWDGKCYVFDDRISVPVNRTEEDVVITECHYCGTNTDRLINCANPECNKQFVCCEKCADAHKESCSEECKEHPRNLYVKKEMREGAL